jgi:RHS repeat-associated protein
VALTDATGNVVERMKYDAFGKVTWLDAAFATKANSSYAWNRTFTGQVLDSETGLMLYRNRYFHTGLGRFINRDPIGYDAEDVSLYRYAGNRPLIFADVLGLQPTEQERKALCQQYLDNPNSRKEYPELSDPNTRGFAICDGNGNNIPCTNDDVIKKKHQTSLTNVTPIILDIVTRCVLEHEKKHVDDHSKECQKGCRPYPVRNKVPQNPAECEAYTEHVKCLEKEKSSCNVLPMILPRLECYKAVAKDLNRVKEARDYFCKKLKK